MCKFAHLTCWLPSLMQHGNLDWFLPAVPSAVLSRSKQHWVGAELLQHAGKADTTSRAWAQHHTKWTPCSSSNTASTCAPGLQIQSLTPALLLWSCDILFTKLFLILFKVWYSTNASKADMEGDPSCLYSQFSQGISALVYHSAVNFISRSNLSSFMVKEFEMQISDRKHPKVGNKMAHAHLHIFIFSYWDRFQVGEFYLSRKPLHAPLALS